MTNRIIKSWNSDRFGYLVVIILPIIFFAEPLFSGKVLYWGTSSTQFFPWMEYAIQSVLDGQIPLWNPNNGWGAPFVANYQTAIFYPINWLLIPFFLVNKSSGMFFGYTILLVLHFQIGGIGFYYLLGRFPLKVYAKILGAMVFVFSGYFLGRINFISMIWAGVWLPWIINGVLEVFSGKSNLRKFICLSLPVALQLLAGHAQTTYYSLLAAGIIFCVLWFRNDKKISFVLVFVGSILFSTALSAVQLLPTAEYLLNSARSDEVAIERALNYSFWPWRLLSGIFPDLWGNPNITRFLGGGNYWEDHFYIGVIPITLILMVCYFLLRRKCFEKKNLWIIITSFAFIIISLILAFGKNTAIYPFLYKHIPTFDMFQAPSRFLIWYVFFAAILAAFGLDVWMDVDFKPNKVGVFIFVFLAVALGTIVGNMYLKVLPTEIVRAIIEGSVLAIMFGVITVIRSKPNKATNINFSMVLLFIVFLDLAVHNQQDFLFVKPSYFDAIRIENATNQNKFVFLDEKSEQFVKFNKNFRFDRFQPLEDLSSASISYLPNTNLFAPVYNLANNFDPLLYGRYAEVMDYLYELPIKNQQAVLARFGVTDYLYFDPIKPTGLQKITLEARNIVQWYDCEQTHSDDEILDRIVYTETTQTELNCLILSGERNSEEAFIDINNQQPVLIESKIQANQIQIKYESVRPGWLAIRLMNYPGWYALLDHDEPLEIKKADFLFVGLVVPEGKHEITLRYEPRSFQLGALCSLVSILILIVILIIVIKKNKNKLFS